MIDQADKRARLADVRGVMRVLDSLRTNDQALGAMRPDVIAAAYAAIDARLEAARRLRLARDHWELRVPVVAQYGLAMGAPIAILRNLQGRSRTSRSRPDRLRPSSHRCRGRWSGSSS